MAQVHGYEYDIFISYAHADNYHIDGAEHGWITRFHQELEGWLIHKRGMRNIKIWRDKELHGNTLFDDTIKQRIQNSALFIVLYSHNYQQSDYCQQEIDWFIEHNNNRPEGSRIGHESRILHLLLNNIPYPEWSKTLPKTSGFPFHDGKDQDFGEPLEESDMRRQQMRKLIEAIVKTMGAFPSQPKIDKPVTQSQPIKIFLAEPPERWQKLRKRLQTEINHLDSTVELLTPIDTNLDIAAHSQQLKQTLNEADLAIHLLDSLPGRYPDGREDISFPKLQAEISIQTDRPTLIWTPKTLEPDDVDEEDSWYRDFLLALHDNNKTHWHYELHKTDRQPLIDQVCRLVNELSNNPRNPTPAQAYLVETHTKDQLHAFGLSAQLQQRNLIVLFNQEYDDPEASLRNFEAQLTKAHKLIIMFGQVAPEWVRGRITALIQIMGREYARGNTLATEIWICLLHGNTQAEVLVNELPQLKLNLIECMNDPHAIDRLMGEIQ